MFDLNAYPLPVRVYDNELFLWDPVRKKKLKYRPEERVRQQFILFLIFSLGIPRSHISVEVPVKNYSQKRPFRADIVIQRAGNLAPEMIVEVKAPGINLDNSVIDQIYRYEKSEHFKHWIFVNGDSWKVFSRGDDSFVPAEGLPGSGITENELLYPAFRVSDWDGIIAMKRFRENKDEWKNNRYTLGLAGVDTPEAVMFWLNIQMLIRERNRLNQLLSGITDESIESDTSFIEFSDSMSMAFWHNVYYLFQYKAVKYALGTSLNTSGNSCLRLIIKKANDQYSYHEEQIIDLISCNSTRVDADYIEKSTDIICEFLKQILLSAAS